MRHRGLLLAAALCALLGIVCVLLPLHIGMTGLCLLLLAAVLAALYVLKRKNAPRVWSGILIVLTALSMAAVFTAMGAIAIQGRDDGMTQDMPEFVVVLGAQIQGEQPSLTLKKRLDRTVEYLSANPQTVAFVSGGQGADEVTTEASVMKSYLTAAGIAPERVIEESRASNTRENLMFSAELAQARGMDTSRVLIVTSDFHMARAKYIARTLSMEPSGLASDTWPWILKVNYTLREVFAFVKAWWTAR